MNSKLEIIKTNTLSTYDPFKKQTRAGFKLNEMDNAWMFSQARAMYSTDKKIGVYETQPVGSDDELNVTSLSEMMQEEAFFNLSNEIKEGNGEATATLFRSWFTLQNMQEMAKPFMKADTRMLHVNTVLNDFVQITAVFKYFDKPVVFSNDSFLLENTSIKESPLWNWIVDQLKQKKHKQPRFFMTRNNDRLSHAVIKTGVTRILGVPTVAGSEPGIEYGLHASLCKGTIVEELHLF